MPATVEAYKQATGRRKTAVARVRIVPGDGVIVVNNRPPSEYFGRRDLETVVTQPLRVTDTTGRFEVSVKVFGGGIAGQAGAVCHGIARALIAADPELRPVLKAAGLLTRDFAGERAQEVRSEASTEGAAVHQAVGGGCRPLTRTTVRARVLGCPVDIVDMATAVQTLVEIVERRRADATSHPGGGHHTQPRDGDDGEAQPGIQLGARVGRARRAGRRSAWCVPSAAAGIPRSNASAART